MLANTQIERLDIAEGQKRGKYEKGTEAGDISFFIPIFLCNIAS